MYKKHCKIYTTSQHKNFYNISLVLSRRLCFVYLTTIMADSLLLKSLQSKAKTLNLSSKHLCKLPKLIGNLEFIFTAIFKNNKLSKLPREFGNLHQVIFLTI